MFEQVIIKEQDSRKFKTNQSTQEGVISSVTSCDPQTLIYNWV